MFYVGHVLKGAKAMEKKEQKETPEEQAKRQELNRKMYDWFYGR
jgi:hypothetical protein